MSIPIVEQIRTAFSDVLSTVNTLAADGTSKGIVVEDVNRYGNGTNDLETVVEQGVDEWLDEAEKGSCVGKDNYHVELLVWVNIHTPAGTAAFDQRTNYIVADVRKAVMAAADSGVLQGLVNWIKPRGMGSTTGMRPFSNQAGEVAGVVIPFTAYCTTALNNPYSL